MLSSFDKLNFYFYSYPKYQFNLTIPKWWCTIFFNHLLILCNIDKVNYRMAVFSTILIKIYNIKINLHFYNYFGSSYSFDF